MTSRAEFRKDESAFRQILGVRFFVGEADAAITIMSRGGLLVVPAAPALKNLREDRAYREALLEADVAIADSSLMVVLWNLVQKDHIRRLSGLKYLRELLTRHEFRQPGQSFWIMPSSASATRNLLWLRSQSIEIPSEDIYVAPTYGATIEDPTLVERIGARRPAHVVITVGGGTQEKLGLYLKRNLSPPPAIHCIGAAIAFLSGDQVRIPRWADRMFLGWLFRCISQPRRYVPRYWSARKLIGLILRYREMLPGPAE